MSSNSVAKSTADFQPGEKNGSNEDFIDNCSTASSGSDKLRIDIPDEKEEAPVKETKTTVTASKTKTGNNGKEATSKTKVVSIEVWEFLRYFQLGLGIG